MGSGLQRLAAWIGRPLHVQEPAALVGGEGGEGGEGIEGGEDVEGGESVEGGEDGDGVEGSDAGAPGEARQVARAEAIVVLGAPLDARDELTEVGRERVRAAAELWRRGGAALVLTSGAITRGEARSEAAALADELVALGVPRAAILLEERARTTAQNARYCAELLRQREARERQTLGPVWLVTQPFHTRRARLCFRRAGVAAWIWPIADSLEHRDARRALRWSLREYLAWAKTLVVR